MATASQIEKIEGLNNEALDSLLEDIVKERVRVDTAVGGLY